MIRLPRRLTLALLAGAVALVALAAGCTKAPSTSAPAPAAPAASAPSTSATQPAAAEAPTMKLVTPADGATVSAGGVKLVVETTGITFAPPSTTKVPGEGHVHFMLDNEPVKMNDSAEYVYEGVKPGVHKLTAELVQNDTTPFDPPVEQKITFTAK